MELFGGVLLGAVVLARPAQADDELVTSNAVSRAWNRYAQLSSRDNPESASMLARGSLDYFAFLRDAAVYGSAEQIRRIPLSERAVVYTLRASMTPEQLLALDGAAMARHCFKTGLYGVPPAEEGESLPELTHVTVIAGDRAVGELGPPTGTQFQYGPLLVRESGQWKVRPESLALDGSILIQQQVTRSGMTEAQMLEYLIADFLDEPDAPPSLVILDRPLRDDAAARTRLNESWPQYDDTYRARLAATEKKADDGDALAMFALGGVLYGGAMPTLAPKDTARGLQWLERASDAGQVQAAALLSMALMRDYTPVKGKPVPPELLAKTLVHTRRAAEGGVPVAMVALGNFIFNGVAGMPAGLRSGRGMGRARRGCRHRAGPQRTSLVPGDLPDRRATRSGPRDATGRPHDLQGRHPAAAELDTVAAALASTGRFDEAVDFQRARDRQARRRCRRDQASDATASWPVPAA